MGYYTNYSLTINTGPFTVSEIASAIAEMMDTDSIYCIYGIKYPSEKLLSDNTCGMFFLCCEESVTWYQHDESMKKLATRFPTATFTLHGEGENRKDVWDTEYNGDTVRTRTYNLIPGEWKQFKRQ